MDEQILEILSRIAHPESDKNIVELGMVEALTVSPNRISFSLRFGRPRDPFAGDLRRQCEQALGQRFPDYAVEVALLFAEAKPTTSAAKKTAAHTPVAPENVRFAVAVMSGKGGVGKSTIAANLAVALAQKGYRVGLIDADIYGPSIPKMFGAEDAKPLLNEKEQIIPVEKYGVKVLSIGFFVKPGDPLIWRAPMATSALKQLLMQAEWGELDFLLVDMPPGTGDIHLTLLQELKLTGVVVVSTPQQVALADALKGINMLSNANVKTRILGLVENMAWFTPAELPQNRYYIFGKGGARQLAHARQLPLLGEIPIVQSICDSGDDGAPAALSDGLPRAAFETLTENLLAQLGKTEDFFVNVEN
ncbi:MAG: Mrp/NBP35 family ATP-binding protein [Prevotellaceae bacterium]|jgi:ATP-binding protein involved in chromosome partitioning|nr:Mrp/NBP35 family ATP-binding protein [Prevotellaceae bacterium]